jgi:hypothetical protein
MTFHMISDGVNVSEKGVYRRHDSPWQKNYNSPLANHIKCSDYFDKFFLLTHTDEQNLFASMLAFEQ